MNTNKYDIKPTEEVFSVVTAVYFCLMNKKKNLKEYMMHLYITKMMQVLNQSLIIY